jgi:hypothetical protein
MSPKGETWGTRAVRAGHRCGPPAGQEGLPQEAIDCCKSNVLVAVLRGGRKMGLRRLAGRDICYAAFNKAQTILSPLRRGTPAPAQTPAPDPGGASAPRYPAAPYQSRAQNDSFWTGSSSPPCRRPGRNPETWRPLCLRRSICALAICRQPRSIPSDIGVCRDRSCVVSPVPKCEGPGAPSSWSGKGTGIVATRRLPVRMLWTGRSSPAQSVNWFSPVGPHSGRLQS